MKLCIAVTCVLLNSVWSAVLAAGSLHDATNHLPPVASYFWSVFLFSALASIGPVTGVLLLRKSHMALTFFVLWIIAIGVAVGFVVSNFLSFEGVDALPAVLFSIPLVLLGTLAAWLLSSGNSSSVLSVIWPVTFVALLLATTAIHVLIEPAEHRVEYDRDYGPTYRAKYELWIPQSVEFYARPFSVSIAMFAWTIMCLQLLLRVDLPRNDT